MAGFNLQR